jgi:hypothetical protein
MGMNDTIPPIYAIYDHPFDYPDEFVCRVWHGMTAELKLFARGKTLAEVRAKLPRGVHNLGRLPEDDPKIVESWI